MNKYYAILGLNATATKDDVRRAFRKLAFQWHPDRNSSPGASEKFMAINEAYEILIGERKAPGYKPGTGTTYSAPRPRAKTAYERGQENINRIHENRKQKLRDLREQYCDPLHVEKNKKKMYTEAYMYFVGAGLVALAGAAIPILTGNMVLFIWTMGPAVGLGLRLLWSGGRIKLRADMIFSGREDYSFNELKEFFTSDLGLRSRRGGTGSWSGW
jgi:hypothetical protein